MELTVEGIVKVTERLIDKYIEKANEKVERINEEALSELQKFDLRTMISRIEDFVTNRRERLDMLYKDVEFLCEERIDITECFISAVYCVTPFSASSVLKFQSDIADELEAEFYAAFE